jgi:hypothetical protein
VDGHLSLIGNLGLDRGSRHFMKRGE